MFNWLENKLLTLCYNVPFDDSSGLNMDFTNKEKFKMAVNLAQARIIVNADKEYRDRHHIASDITDCFYSIELALDKINNKH